MKKVLFSVLAAATLFTACKKDDDNNATATSRIVGRWLMTGDRSFLTVNGTGGSVNNYSARNACENDDIYVFGADNSLVREEGQTKCRSTDQSSTPLGTWALFNNDTRLRYVNDTFEVVTLSSSNMTLRRAVIQSGSSKVDTLTYQKQ